MKVHLRAFLFGPIGATTSCFILTVIITHSSLTISVSRLLSLFRCYTTVEKLPKCKTPQEYRLTTELNKRFVETVRGVTYQLMFSKDQRAVATNQKTLRYLAWIEPGLIIPGVLERAYPSLESLTESHRTTSVISALGALAVPMLNREHYPQGGKHLAPLLHLTVPGVDMNDPVKTWYTLLFVTSMVSTVPIRDLTEMGSAGFEWGGIDIDMLDSEGTVDLDLEDSSRKASTADFEEWLMKFLRRVILMVRAVDFFVLILREPFFLPL